MHRLVFARASVTARGFQRASLPHAVRPILAVRKGLALPRYNSGAAKPVPPVEPKVWDAPKLTFDQVKARSEQPSPDAYIIDVREPDEVIQGSIPSSVNLPLSVLAESLHLNPVAFKEKHGYNKPRPHQELVFYCRSGKRSATAADVAKKNGYTNIYNYEGSWIDWTARQQGPK